MGVFLLESILRADLLRARMTVLVQVFMLPLWVCAGGKAEGVLFRPERLMIEGTVTVLILTNTTSHKTALGARKNVNRMQSTTVMPLAN